MKEMHRMETFIYKNQQERNEQMQEPYEEPIMQTYIEWKSLPWFNTYDFTLKFHHIWIQTNLWICNCKPKGRKKKVIKNDQGDVHILEEDLIRDYAYVYIHIFFLKKGAAVVNCSYLTEKGRRK